MQALQQLLMLKNNYNIVVFNYLYEPFKADVTKYTEIDTTSIISIKLYKAW